MKRPHGVILVFIYLKLHIIYKCIYICVCMHYMCVCVFKKFSHLGAQWFFQKLYSPLPISHCWSSSHKSIPVSYFMSYTYMLIYIWQKYICHSDSGRVIMLSIMIFSFIYFSSSNVSLFFLVTINLHHVYMSLCKNSFISW